MSKKEFIIRLSAFIILGCIAPFLFIAFRYDLFKKVNEMSLSGWGLIAVVIVFFFARYVLKMIKMGMPYSMFTQCISGALKVILPLLCLYFCVDAIRTSIDLFQFKFPEEESEEPETTYVDTDEYLNTDVTDATDDTAEDADEE
jgi:hypothetical protein